MSEPLQCCSRWFAIATMIGSAIATGVAIANCYYYHKLTQPHTSPGVVSPLTHGEATAMFWLNIIVAVFSLIIFIWSIFSLIRCRHHTHYYEEPLIEMEHAVCPLPSPPRCTIPVPKPISRCSLPMEHPHHPDNTDYQATRTVQLSNRRV